MTCSKKLSSFKDKCVIYYSRADHAWIAHSLRTDQLGYGECVVDALVDLLIGTRNLLALKRKDPDIELFHSPPPKIKRYVKNASPLPPVLWEIALGRFLKKIPYRIHVDVPKSDRLTVQFPEPQIA